MKTITKATFLRFLDGETTPAETKDVWEAINTNPFWRQRYIAVKRYEAISAEEENHPLPLEKMAAQTEDNLCDILCERHILRNLFPEYYSGTALSEAKDEQAFLKSKIEGVALYNVGRIMERYGLAITRQFRASLSDLKRLTAMGEGIIVVVSQNILEGAASGEPDHAVCVLKADDTFVTIYDPVSFDDNISARTESIPADTFLRAWSASEYYLVSANRPENKDYTPHPLDLSDVPIDEKLTELLESMAEDLHDLWAVNKLEAGFKYAPLDENGNEQPGCNHYLVPYSMLSEQDKGPDRKNASQTLKLVQRLGYTIKRANETCPYHCPKCHKIIELAYLYCPHCGKKLDIEDY